MSTESKKISETEKATEYLANERTFLAWIRTSIAIVSIGIILAKVGPFLRQQQAGRAVQALPSSIGTSLPMGLAMIVFGAVLPLLAAWRYHVVNLGIERGEVKADRWLVLLIAILVVLLTAGIIFYMLTAPDQL
ncbi:MAG TPA: DUF202 domain-containing protein [Acidobacteriota bacterium]